MAVTNSTLPIRADRRLPDRSLA